MPTGTLGRDELTGTNNDDMLVGDALNLPVAGKKRGGNDTITGGLGEDTLFGDAGNDSDPASDGILDEARGGNDRIEGGADDDTIYGDGREMVDGAQGGNDILFGDAGDDTIYGDAEAFFESRGGNDKIYGGAGNDYIYGDAESSDNGSRGGNDIIYGGDGDDRLFGDFDTYDLSTRGGNDILFGGAGNDNFVLGRGKDKIKDFVKGQDVLRFDDTLLDFSDLDTDGDGELTSEDEFVTVKGKNVIIDLGAAAGGDPGVDVTIITVGKNIVLEASDFVL